MFLMNKRSFKALLVFPVFFPVVFFAASSLNAQTIRIQTGATSLIYVVDKSGELKQAYIGDRLADTVSTAMKAELSAYPAYGRDDVNEPALRALHADGNLTTA